MKRKLDAANVPTPESPQPPQASSGGGVSGSVNGGKKSRSGGAPSFSSYGLDARILQALAKQNFAAPTPVQAKAIPLALEGKDILARSKTGSGKTAAYLLPILQTILKRKEAKTTESYASALILVPTRELAEQVLKVVVSLTAYCASEIRAVNLTHKIPEAVQRALLADSPDIVIATPARAAFNVNNAALSLDRLEHLVVDEADLVLSFGYDEDLRNVAKASPKGVQTFLMSATLSSELDTVKKLFCRDPVVIELEEKEDDSGGQLSQFVVRCAEDEKFLLIYVIFKLKLVRGKCIVFVGDIERCYRVKLFLEQFGIKACVLNSELPINSRVHVVEQFNKNIYNIIIATDEQDTHDSRPRDAVATGDSAQTNDRAADADSNANANTNTDADANANDESGHQKDEPQRSGAEPDHQRTDAATAAAAAAAKQKKLRKERRTRDYGVSRGIDFKNVACVLNFDLPASATAYAHRVGRTARAGASGMALSFAVPPELFRKHRATSFAGARHDEAVLAEIAAMQRARGSGTQGEGGSSQSGAGGGSSSSSSSGGQGGGGGGGGLGGELTPYHFDMAQIVAFRYRAEDALRAVTGAAVREARARELRRELLRSEKLRRHFEENPGDLRQLRHDSELHTARVQAHLKHVPEYLMPKMHAGGGNSSSGGGSAGGGGGGGDGESDGVAADGAAGAKGAKNAGAVTLASLAKKERGKDDEAVFRKALAAAAGVGAGAGGARHKRRDKGKGNARSQQRRGRGPAKGRLSSSSKSKKKADPLRSFKT